MRGYERKKEARGEVKGKAEFLLLLLQHKFKIIPVHYQQKTEQADEQYLRKLLEKVLTCSAIEEVFEEKKLQKS
jgi:hypothetical protein